MDTFIVRDAALQLVQDALLSSSNSETVRNFIQDLPVLLKEQIPPEDNCPICLLPFLDIFDDGEESTEEDEGGITKLEGCGHLFCRRDLVEWIRTHHLNCPTCRFQFIQINTHQDDASSDGGEYLPSSEGEDIEIAVNASEQANSPAEDTYDAFVPDWEDEVESGPIVDPQLEEYEAMTEAWMDDYDPEYSDVGVEGGNLDYEPECIDEGLMDPELDLMIEDAGSSNFGPCLEEEDPDTDAFHDEVTEPVFNPAMEDDAWEPPEFDPAEGDRPCDTPAFDPAEEDGSCNPPEFDPADMQDETQDEYLDSELTMDETFEDVKDPGSPSEELECTLDFDPASNAEYESDCMDEALGGLEDNYPVVESSSDSEQEELEVELGLTDGESNASSPSEDEIPGLVLPVQTVSVEISADDDGTGETIISHTYDSQFLK